MDRTAPVDALATAKLPHGDVDAACPFSVIREINVKELFVIVSFVSLVNLFVGPLVTAVEQVRQADAVTLAFIADVERRIHAARSQP